MPTIAETLYEQLDSHNAVQELIGKVEDAFFECKEWRAERSSQDQIAKAACGFTNADGGVIVVGLEARRNNDGIDMVTAERPVPDAESVRSQIEEAISKKVEPGIKGVRSKTIPAVPGSVDGFIITHVPGSDASPCRCTFSPKEFYVRIGPQTLPMPYFMIADRFGRRPQPKLIVDVQFDSLRPTPRTRQGGTSLCSDALK
jgi:predicted HTH transcriptional regulator